MCWDGKLAHLCSLLQGAPPALLGALADRLLIASRATPAGAAGWRHGGGGGGGRRGWHAPLDAPPLCLPASLVSLCGARGNPSAHSPPSLFSLPALAGRVEVGGRGVSLLQPLLLGWASLAQRRVLPGGATRVRRELRTLVASYDASQLGVEVLERLAAAGFADVAAAVAARWAALARALLLSRLDDPWRAFCGGLGFCGGLSVAPERVWRHPVPAHLPLVPPTRPSALPQPQLLRLAPSPLRPCSSDSPAITPAHKAVFRAAAGDWQPLLALVLSDWEQSGYHPG